MSRIAEIFGSNIKKVRKRIGLSQGEVALKLGVTTPNVSRWESGDYLPNADQIDKLCEFLGVSASDMFQTNHKPAASISLPEALDAINSLNMPIVIRLRTQKKSTGPK